jgi:hypothetical protein
MFLQEHSVRFLKRVRDRSSHHRDPRLQNGDVFLQEHSEGRKVGRLYLRSVPGRNTSDVPSIRERVSPFKGFRSMGRSLAAPLRLISPRVARLWRGAGNCKVFLKERFVVLLG